jgi:exosortase/archaeosortase family protein
MLFMFFATSFAVVLVIRRPAIDKAVIVLSAVPIALAANVTRITVTGLLHELAGGKVADAVYHDLAGWLMMPLALGAVWLEFWLLSLLFVERRAAGLAPIAFSDVIVPLRANNAFRQSGRPAAETAVN